MSFWDRNVIEAGKLPLLLLFAAFTCTWLITRTITRSIRAGRGPLHDLSAGGTHLHHSVPGILLLTTSAIASTALPPHAPWREIAAVGIGVGASLVFDEFAMILHLDDDYWTAEGRQSVGAVGLVASCLALSIVGFVPFGVDDVGTAELGVRWATVAVVLATLASVIVCAMKGKYRMALVAVFVWPVALAGAVRLARPGSPWDRRVYAHEPARREHATRRAAAFDERWDPRWRRLADAIGGRPTTS